MLYQRVWEMPRTEDLGEMAAALAAEAKVLLAAAAEQEQAVWLDRRGDGSYYLTTANREFAQAHGFQTMGASYDKDS